MRKINIFVIACFAFFAHLQASCGLSPSTIEEMARELYTQQVRKAFNFHPVVIAGEEVIPYYHNPIPKGVMVCQAEAKFLEAESAKSILYSPNLTSCQLVVIRNETTKRTGMYSLDQFFNLAGIPETLNSYGSRELISVRIVVNKTFRGCPR